MSVLICKLNGSRGRHIAVYDNKCVITTNVSLGSILTNNALDGRKTIFYIDVQGIQFKKSGVTLGYLQLETASIQMNNQSSNMFSENTFTFENTTNGVPNDLMEKLHDYIVDRIESYKYGTPAQNEYLYDLVTFAEKTSTCYVDNSILEKVKNELNEQAQRREQEHIERMRVEHEAHQRAVEEFQRLTQDKGDSARIELFLEQAATYTRVAEILKLWKTFTWDNVSATTMIDSRISKAAQFERMYGNSPDSVQTLLNDIKKMTCI